MQSKILDFIIQNYLPAISNAMINIELTVPLFKRLFLQNHVVRSALIDMQLLDSEREKRQPPPIANLREFQRSKAGTNVDFVIYQQALFNQPVLFTDNIIEAALEKQKEQNVKPKFAFREDCDCRLLKYILQDSSLQKLITTAATIALNKDLKIKTAHDLFETINKQPWLLQYIAEYVYFNAGTHPIVYDANTGRIRTTPSAMSAIELLPGYLEVFDWLVLSYWEHEGKSLFELFEPTCKYVVPSFEETKDLPVTPSDNDHTDKVDNNDASLILINEKEETIADENVINEQSLDNKTFNDGIKKEQDGEAQASLESQDQVIGVQESLKPENTEQLFNNLRDDKSKRQARKRGG